MTEDINIAAFRYLCDELGADDRAAFEAQLAHDPAARAVLKECSAAVAQFASETAPAEAMPPSAQRAALATILATMVAPDLRRQPILWRRWVWPMAAAALLGLNLVQLFRSASIDALRGKNQNAPARAEQPPAVTGQSGAGINQAMNTMAANQHSAQAEHPSDHPLLVEERRRLEKLRSDYANLERAREALRAEYNGIMRQLAPAGKGVDRLAAMELVDAGSYARGERKGLTDIASNFLTEPEIVAIGPEIAVNPPSVPLVSPPAATEPGTTNPGPDIINSDQKPTSSSAGASSPTATPGASSPAASDGSSGPSPSAWSVFDEANSQGYLNLYNLPAVPADQLLQLWVKAANATDYQRVGEVPAQFYGKSGSLIYSLPGATQPPSEILITQEPRNATPTQPTGPTVLHGP
jgi:anti-sigma-K factor RskA